VVADLDSGCQYDILLGKVVFIDALLKMPDF